MASTQRMVRSALKLKVPWIPDLDPLEVEFSRVENPNYNTVMHRIRDYGAPQVSTNEDGDVLVENFFGVNNRVLDVSRYHIGNNRRPVRHVDVPESRLQIQRQSRPNPA